MARRKWMLRNVDKSLAKELAYECGINQLSALILCGRGFADPVDIFEFFDEDISLQSPFIIPGMVEAVERINKAITNGEKIGICGDYDADGITASALLYRYLISKGVEVTTYIPERLEEGYGIHISTIDFLKSRGVTLAITVDNGISAYDEVEYAKTQEIDIVITDHHLSGGEIPNAVAVVDPQVNMPKGEFADYSGVGVAFKLVCALEDADPMDMMEQYGDILSIGTVADIVPLKGENRIFVKKGIEILNRRNNLGVSELIKAAGLEGRELTAYNVAFGLSPRINAAGRMGKSFRAFRLLVTENVEEARLLCNEICEDNYLRQTIEAQITAKAIEMCLNNPELLYSEVLVVAGEGWHQGVLGIVASRLCEKFGKPAVVFSIDGEDAVGSARSTEGFNIFDALDSCRHLTVRLGGHKKAAGLSLKAENIDILRKNINDFAKNQNYDRFEYLTLECGLTPAGVSDKTAIAALELGPFGFGNPEPLFGLMGMEIVSINHIPNKNTVKLILSRGGEQVSCIKFSTPPDTFPFEKGDKVDVAINFSMNFFRGEKNYSAVVKGMKFSESDDEIIINSNILYQKFKQESPLSQIEKQTLIPNRDDVAKIFRYIREKNGFNFSAETLYHRIDRQVEYAKILIALDVLEDLSFISRKFDGENQYITYNANASKQDLYSSKIFELLS